MGRYGRNLVLVCTLVYLVLAALVWAGIKESLVKNITVFGLTVGGLAISYAYQALHYRRLYLITPQAEEKATWQVKLRRVASSIPELIPDLIGIILMVNLAADAWKECAGIPGRYIATTIISMVAIIVIALFFCRIRYSDLYFRKVAGATGS